jgi:hypothetical protein
VISFAFRSRSISVVGFQIQNMATENSRRWLL